jgi:exonuclease SbcC
MRPVRLELSGFAAFREPTVIDFTDADLFVLAGATGAGKSTVIDAMVFALYGTIPRLIDERSKVAPVVTQGKQEARVRFDFTVGEDSFTAVRVVRRTKAGATTKEARLEHNGEVVAGTAGEVNDAVQRLFGLSLDHFTKSVVIPQGDFARFLHDRPGDRQKLLVELLELGVYKRIAELARRRQHVAEGEAAAITRQLEKMKEVTTESAAAAAERVAALEALVATVEQAQPKAAELEAEHAAAEAKAAEHSEAIRRLEALEAPKHLDELADQLKDARAAAAEAEKLVTSSSAALDDAEKARDSLPDPETFEQAVRLDEQLTKEKRRLAEAAAAVVAAEKQLGKAAERRETETKHLNTAAAALEAARAGHTAADLAAALVVGQPCPVCGNIVTEKPHPKAPGLDEPRQDLETAKTALDKADAEHRGLEQEHAVKAANAARAEKEVAELDAERSAMPAAAEAKAALEERAKRSKAAEEAAAAARRASREKASADEVLRSLAVRERETTAALLRSRDAVADLRPPEVAGDMAEDWRALLGWAADKVPNLDKERKQAEKKSTTAAAALEALDKEISTALRREEVAAAGAPRDSAVDALAAARAEVARLAETLDEASRLREARQREQDSAAVARELAAQLGAQRFERWVLQEALHVLVVGANQRLEELSGGQYSLKTGEDLSFEIIDHHNADEARPVKTLSGGETFLTSLALALSLADHLAEMSAGASKRLESIFLDEGFGTLDAEGIEAAAAIVHEIGATGRTVGLVTHVASLAEQVPTRFVVTKGARSATVERIDA